MLGPFERYATRNIMHVSDDEGAHLLQAVYERIGEDPSDLWHQVLGKGSYAVVTWLKSDKKKVLKITEDDSDADAMEALRKKPSKHCVKVYDVFDLKNFGWGWGIVAQKVTPLDARTASEWNSSRITLQKFIGQRPPLGLGLVPLYQEKLEQYISGLGEYERTKKYSPEKLETLRQFLKTLAVFDEELGERGIKGIDDYHAKNLGMNRRDIVLLDLGGGRIATPVLPKIDVS